MKAASEAFSGCEDHGVQISQGSGRGVEPARLVRLDRGIARLVSAGRMTFQEVNQFRLCLILVRVWRDSDGLDLLEREISSRFQEGRK